jgi:hypothetical protein
MLALLDRRANWCSLTASQHPEDRLPRRSMSKRNMRTRGPEAGREVYGGDSWCNGIEWVDSVPNLQGVGYDGDRSD